MRTISGIHDEIVITKHAFPWLVKTEEIVDTVSYCDRQLGYLKFLEKQLYHAGFGPIFTRIRKVAYAELERRKYREYREFIESVKALGDTTNYWATQTAYYSFSDWCQDQGWLILSRRLKRFGDVVMS